MKHLLIISLALLFCLGVAFSVHAANIPTVTSPSDSGERWLMNVYNNSGAALDDGDIVIWDIDASTGDDYMYVDTIETQDTGPIAGVVNGSISTAEVGQIVIYGQKDVDLAGIRNGGIGVTVTTSTTTGSGEPIGGAKYYVGFLMETVAKGTSSASIMVNPGTR